MPLGFPQIQAPSIRWCRLGSHSVVNRSRTTRRAGNLHPAVPWVRVAVFPVKSRLCLVPGPQVPMGQKAVKGQCAQRIGGIQVSCQFVRAVVCAAWLFQAGLLGDFRGKDLTTSRNRSDLLRLANPGRGIRTLVAVSLQEVSGKQRRREWEPDHEGVHHLWLQETRHHCEVGQFQLP